MVRAAALATMVAVVAANDNGLAKTPPRGWRSWNLYGNNVNRLRTRNPPRVASFFLSSLAAREETL